MIVALLTAGLPRPRGVEVVGEGVAADVAVARGWSALRALAATRAERRIAVVDGLEGAPASLDERIVLVAGARWLAELLPGERVRVLRSHRPALAPGGPAPLTREKLRDEVLVDPAGIADVLAAFAAGRTVVGADTPALREVVTDGFDGLLVPGGSPRALRRTVRSLDADRVRLHLLRHNAHLTARAWPAEAQQATVLEAIVRQVAREPAPEPPGALPVAQSDGGGLLARLLRR